RVFLSSLRDSDPGFRQSQSVVLLASLEFQLYVGPSSHALLVSLVRIQFDFYFCLRRFSDHFNASGVISVVTITMITTALNVPELSTGSVAPVEVGSIRVAPIPAKINPTSPRGIIPNPIVNRSKPRSSTPREQICLPTIAAKVSNRAKPRISNFANSLRSTFNPINTKKIGTRTVLTGCSRSLRSLLTRPSRGW